MKRLCIWLSAAFLISFPSCTKDEGGGEIEVTSVSISASAVKLNVGGQKTLKAFVSPFNATDQQIVWESSDPACVRVEEGELTALKLGTAVVTASNPRSGKSASCDVTVQETPVIHVSSVTLNTHSAELEMGAEIILRATVLPENADDRSIFWSSDDQKVATVQDGKVHAVAPGETVIRARSGDGNKTDSCTITVSGLLTVARNGQSTYVVSHLNADSFAASELVKAIKDTAKAELERVSPLNKRYDTEILVGDTGTDETAALKAKIGQYGYGIEVSGKRIAIAGSDQSFLSLALYWFEKNVLRNEEFNRGGTLSVPADLSHILTSNSPITFSQCLKENIDFTTGSELVGESYSIGNCGVAQGAATDGKHVYFVLRSTDDTNAIIRKYTLEPFSHVSNGEYFYGGHCNDLTFDNENSRIVVAHGQSEGKTLTMVDSNTLKKTEDVSITVGSGAITYEPSRKNYAISQGGTTLYVTDPGFKVLRSFTRSDKTGYTAQGMGSDPDYIYFPMSKTGTDNKLVTYDWEGNYIGIITVNITLESESMFSCNGKYYVNFYAGSSKGAVLYRIFPEISYRFRQE